MSADEARAEAERRFPHAASDPDVASSRSVRRLTFRQGAEWRASRPFTEEDVEAAAKAISEAHVPTTGPTPPWESEEPAWKDTYRDFARAALDAVTAHRTKGDDR